jgi:RHS repeat-associated protein
MSMARSYDHLHRRLDGNDRTAVSAALNATIDQAAYRSEFDIDRSGTITTADRTIASTTRSALAGGGISNAATGGPDNPIGWDGYVFNAETRLYTVRYRTYEPVLGRWMQRDPLEYLPGAALHELAEGRPVDWNDPLGLAACAPEPCGACKSGLEQALQDPRVAKLLEAMKKECPDCADEPIACYMPGGGNAAVDAFCDRKTKEGMGQGGLDISDPGAKTSNKTGKCYTAYLCCNKTKVGESLVGVVLEELIHRYDMCKGHLPFDRCDKCLCTELRAAKARGHKREEAYRLAWKTCLDNGHCERRPRNPRKPTEQEDRREIARQDGVARSMWKRCVEKLPSPWQVDEPNGPPKPKVPK